MKVGLIGLGRMGEGMSRRMMKQGIEVYGYRRNFAKAQEAADNGYITAAADSLESLVQVVKRAESIYGEKSGETVYVKSPGIFQLVIPAELVEDTLNELLPLLGDGDIIIDHGNSNFKDSRRRAERLEKLGIQYLDCGTSGGVYGLERGYCLMVGGASGAVSVCAPIFRALAPGITAAPRTDTFTRATSAEYGWLHCGGPGAGHFVKMVHNGVEYGIMQAYAEGFNILHHGNLGSKYVKEGDAEVAPMENPADYQYDIDTVEGSWLLAYRRYGVVVLLLVVGYLTLPLMFCGMILNWTSSMVEYQTLVRVVGLFTVLWISVFPLLLLVLPSLRDSTHEDSESMETKS